MRLFSRIYSITIFENNRLCWKVTHKEKSKQDYINDCKWVIFTWLMILLYSILRVNYGR